MLKFGDIYILEWSSLEDIFDAMLPNFTRANIAEYLMMKHGEQ
jgi:hypothetical protein